MAATYAEETVLDRDGRLDYYILKPVLFEMPTYQYLKTGEVLGKCWVSAGIWRKRMKRISAFMMAAVMVFSLAACGRTPQASETGGTETEADPNVISSEETGQGENRNDTVSAVSDNFVLITGGTFEMGSPETEGWRSEDETQHTVTVSDFYMSRYEVTQAEYAEAMGSNPSSFSGNALPVENVSWLDAVSYCNARSEMEGLTSAYTIDGQKVTWDRSADGYRLPTEAEWEYACRAGTTTPFNTETSISAEGPIIMGIIPMKLRRIISPRTISIPNRDSIGRQRWR